MTRLRSDDLRGLGREGLATYDRIVAERTGRTLRRIACRAVGITEDDLLERLTATMAAAVSITSGDGAICGFAEAVEAVLTHLGLTAFVPRGTDLAGIAEAVSRRATLLLLADDFRFDALNLRAGFVAENAEWTGRGFAAALEGLAGGVVGEPTLVIGAGRVGRGAAMGLCELGARVAVFDRDPARARRLAADVGGVVETDLDHALARHSRIVEATPAADLIEARHLRTDTVVAAPGMPLGVTAEARERLAARLIHDPLPIGVAAMAVAALAGPKPSR